MKKKVCIITILDVANFGTMLQAYALAKRIKEQGMDVEFIDYTRPLHSPFDKFKTFCKDESLGNVVKRFCFGGAALLSYSYIRMKARRFVTKAFPFSKSFYDLESLRHNTPKADLYLTGSDQVWNSSYNGGIDPVFFLDFVEGKKVAYAASVGMSAFPKEEIPIIKRMLNKYIYVSVREKQTESYLKQLGFPNVTQVLDPTLLLNKEDWENAVGYIKQKHEPYLLVYSVERFNNDFIFEQARRIAKARKLKMYVVSSTYPVKAKDYGFEKIFSMASVKQFITLMIDAEFVVASSFHGTAFSVNFNKDFITISAKQFNIRMESIVKQFDIAHRIVAMEFVDEQNLKPIDYSTINSKLKIERERSTAFLNKILSV